MVARLRESGLSYATGEEGNSTRSTSSPIGCCASASTTARSPDRSTGPSPAPTWSARSPRSPSASHGLRLRRNGPNSRGPLAAQGCCQRALTIFHPSRVRTTHCLPASLGQVEHRRGVLGEAGLPRSGVPDLMRDAQESRGGLSTSSIWLSSRRMNAPAASTRCVPAVRPTRSRARWRCGTRHVDVATRTAYGRSAAMMPNVPGHAAVAAVSRRRRARRSSRETCICE